MRISFKTKKIEKQLTEPKEIVKTFNEMARKVNQRMKELKAAEREILSPPGDTLLETLEELNMSQNELAERMGRPIKTINEVIKGKTAITAETAIQLERVLGIPASFWLNREREYREELVRIESQEFLEGCIEWLDRFPVSAMKKMNWLPNTNKKSELASALLSFFGIVSPKQWDIVYCSASVSFRISLAHTNQPEAISAWLRKGHLQAMGMQVMEYSKTSFKNRLIKIRKELVSKQPENFQIELQEICSEVGVKVVYTPNLPKATISGATRWIGNNPVIQLSGRYKTNDHFWFTFFHEIGHILLHGKKDIFLEDVKGGNLDDKKEQEANMFSSDFLIDPIIFNKFLEKSNFSENSIIRFAKQSETHPGIIVGRLQHDDYLDYSEMNHLKKKIEILNTDNLTNFIPE